MFRVKHTLVWGVILGVVLVGLRFSPTQAQAASGGTALTTAPVTDYLTASPGTTISTDLSVENDGTSAVTINVKVEKFTAKGTDGQAQLYIPPYNDPSIGWLHFSQTSFVAEPGVWKTVTMTLSPPASAALGYYYAILFVPNINTKLAEGSNAVKSANAILVLLNVKVPNEKTQLAISGFSANKKLFQYLPVNFNVNVRNDGNIYTAPEGNIFISRTPNGPTIDSLQFNSGEGNVLPSSNRVFTTSWSDGFPVYQLKRVHGEIISAKNGQPVQQLDWNFNKVSSFRFGKYYAHLVLVYNNGVRDIAVNGYVSFWVIPWFAILLVLIVVALIIIGIWNIIKKPVKKAIHKKQE